MNQHRDSLASYIGHHNLIEFFAVAENESKARIKFNFLQVQWLMFTAVHLSFYVVYICARKCYSLVVIPMRNLKRIENRGQDSIFFILFDHYDVYNSK